MRGSGLGYGFRGNIWRAAVFPATAPDARLGELRVESKNLGRSPRRDRQFAGQGRPSPVACSAGVKLWSRNLSSILQMARANSRALVPVDAGRPFADHRQAELLPRREL